MWWPQLKPGSFVQKFWVSKLLTQELGRLGEHRLSRGRSEVVVGLEEGIKGGLGEVAQGGSAAPD